MCTVHIAHVACLSSASSNSNLNPTPCTFSRINFIELIIFLPAENLLWNYICFNEFIRISFLFDNTTWALHITEKCSYSGIAFNFGNRLKKSLKWVNSNGKHSIYLKFFVEHSKICLILSNIYTILFSDFRNMILFRNIDRYTSPCMKQHCFFY